MAIHNCLSLTIGVGAIELNVVVSKLNLSPPVRLALIYLIVSVLWILLSDQLLEVLVKEQAVLSTLQTVKGWAFVALTAVLLYRLANREMKHMAEKNRELEMWGHRLEDRVAERTIELATSNKRLEALDNFKSKMISEISHELRSPITSIGLKIELLERVDPSNRMQYITELKEQILKLRELLNDVTDIALMEQDETRAFSLVDMNQLTKQVTDELRPLAEVAGLQLDYELDDGTLSVMGRHNQLARMLANLVTNAIKYTETGRIMIRLARDSERGEVIVQVEDTGIGIAPEARDHLFDRFYRSERVKQRNIPGSGLGLSIVKDIVENHRGSIKFESTLDVGSTFVVRLPFETAQPDG